MQPRRDFDSLLRAWAMIPRCQECLPDSYGTVVDAAPYFEILRLAREVDIDPDDAAASIEI